MNPKPADYICISGLLVVPSSRLSLHGIELSAPFSFRRLLDFAKALSHAYPLRHQAG